MDVYCQLIYSDGGETGSEDFWKFHTIALCPFVLGIPPGKVSLILYRGFLGLADNDVDAGLLRRRPPVIGEMSEGWLPHGYHEYFMLVYKEAKSIDEIAELDQKNAHTLRIISGRGFFDFQHGGFIRCGKEKVTFEELGKSSASVLNILDIRNSPHAVACFNKTYPTTDPSTFKWKRVFRDLQKIGVKIACDKSPMTWPFRIGYEDQPDDDNDTDHWISMSAPIGDAVTSCVLSAVRSFAEAMYQGPSLDELFYSHYSSLRTGYLEAGTYTPKGFSDLKVLEQLIKDSAPSLDLAKFDCEMFRRRGKWFLTHERVTVLGDSDDGLAKLVIDHVVKAVKNWHEEHPNSFTEIADSRAAWNTLLKTLGQFRTRIKSLEFDYADDRRQALVLSDDGIVFEAFAVSCGVMRDCLQQVQNWLATGQFEISSESESE